MLKVASDVAAKILTELKTSVIWESMVPEHWLRSLFVNCYNGKGDTPEWRKGKKLKLFDHAFKVIELEF